MSAVEGSYERAEEYPVVLDRAAQRSVMVPENASLLIRQLFELFNLFKRRRGEGHILEQKRSTVRIDARVFE